MTLPIRFPDVPGPLSAAAEDGPLRPEPPTTIRFREGLPLGLPPGADAVLSALEDLSDRKNF